MADALSIVQEYLSDPSSRIRGNASTALAVLGGPQAMKLLVKVAVTEEDANVRQRAIHEISTLSDEAREAARTELHRLLDDKSYVDRAYFVLSILGPSHVPQRRHKRFGMAFRFWRSRFREGVMGRLGRGLLWGVGTGALGGLVIGALLFTSLGYRLMGVADYSYSGAMFELAGMALILGLVAGAVATILITPLPKAPDLWAMTAVQVTILTVAGIFFSVVLITMLQLPPTELPLAAAILPLFPGIIRIGTLGGMAFPSLQRRLWSVLGGGGGGAFVATLWLFSAGDFIYQVATPWLVMLPVSLALAAALVAVDASGDLKRVPVVRHWLPATVPVLGWAALLLPAAFDLPEVIESDGAQSLGMQINITSPRDTAILVSNSPAEQALVFQAPYSVTLDIPNDRRGRGEEDSPDSVDYQIELIRVEPGEPPFAVALEDDPPRIEYRVERGPYRVRVARFGELHRDVAYPILANLALTAARRIVEPEVLAVEQAAAIASGLRYCLVIQVAAESGTKPSVQDADRAAREAALAAVDPTASTRSPETTSPITSSC